MDTRLVDLMKAIEELENLAPEGCTYNFTRAGLRVHLFGSQICFVDGGDFMSVAEARAVIEDLATTFGGKVKWEGKK